ncbi:MULTISPECIES: phosphotransferase [unclassified Mycobacterium]|uniref:phosphotransferase family protein n=1 Tax=unclassified Mycobacterium TaxID=2642494 RepID=UPI00068A7CF8|nr:MULTISPECIES: phosphotransferase [unclassified Mycobacterium]SEA60971.1 Predicted kinase, aminoglycoside phosphotransferase (APT) family [Mycobacterium sp. 283mftsu]
MLKNLDPTACLTASLLNEALAGVRGDAEVVGLSSMAVGTGQVAVSARLAIEYDRPTAAPRRLIAKFADPDPERRRQVRREGAYEREVRFYRELAPRVTVCTPTVYAAEFSSETGDFLLLLEDLAPALQGDQLAGCTVDVAATAMDQIAGLHAPCWGEDRWRELQWLRRDRPGIAAVTPRLWASFQDRYSGLISDEIRCAGELFVKNLDAWLSRETRHRTVVHRDFRLDNVLIGEQGSMAVVDWQTCAIGSGPEDVAYFLGSGLRAELRHKLEEGLVRRYHDCIVELGVHGYSWSECWLDYRRGAWHGMLMSINAAMLARRTDRGDQMFLTMAQRYARQVLELNSAGALS